VDGPSNEARNCGSDFNLVRLPRSDSDLDLSLEELRVELNESRFTPKNYSCSTGMGLRLAASFLGALP
jgi:hypothetical protein